MYKRQEERRILEEERGNAEESPFETVLPQHPVRSVPVSYTHLKCIREDILTGKITPGTKLPSKRSFAENLGVSVITVENAYAQLVSEGRCV